jgi:hypothetical protein
MVVPLAQQLLVALSDVAKLLRTATATARLGDRHVHLLARLALNNFPEATAAYSLSPLGRAESRNRERGYSTQNLTDDIPFHLFDGQCDLNACMGGHAKYDDAIGVLCQLIINTNWVIILELPTAGELGGRPAQEVDEGTIVVETYKGSVTRFASLSELGRMSTDIYRALYGPATKFIVTLGAKLGIDIEMVKTRLEAWLFASHTALSAHTDQILRHAY